MIENDRLKKSVKWTGKSYGGRFGNARFAFLLRFGVLPSYALVALVAAFFMVFRRRQCNKVTAKESRSVQKGQIGFFVVSNREMKNILFMTA